VWLACDAWRGADRPGGVITHVEVRPLDRGRALVPEWRATSTPSLAGRHPDMAHRRLCRDGAPRCRAHAVAWGGVGNATTRQDTGVGEGLAPEPTLMLGHMLGHNRSSRPETRTEDHAVASREMTPKRIPPGSPFQVWAGQQAATRRPEGLRVPPSARPSAPSRPRAGREVHGPSLCRPSRRSRRFA